MFVLRRLLVELLFLALAMIPKLFPHPIDAYLALLPWLCLPSLGILAYEHKVLLPSKHFLELRNNSKFLQKTGITGVS